MFDIFGHDSSCILAWKVDAFYFVFWIHVWSYLSYLQSCCNMSQVHQKLSTNAIWWSREQRNSFYQSRTYFLVYRLNQKDTMVQTLWLSHLCSIYPRSRASLQVQESSWSRVLTCQPQSEGCWDSWSISSSTTVQTWLYRVSGAGVSTVCLWSTWSISHQSWSWVSGCLPPLCQEQCCHSVWRRKWLQCSVQNFTTQVRYWEKFSEMGFL